MEYRTLGRTGLEVSAIGLGMEHMLKHSPEEMAAVLETAVAGGITYIDLLYEGVSSGPSSAACSAPTRTSSVTPRTGAARTTMRPTTAGAA